MNRIIVFISFVVSIGLINSGASAKKQVGRLSNDCLHLRETIAMEREIKLKKDLVKHKSII